MNIKKDMIEHNWTEGDMSADVGADNWTEGDLSQDPKHKLQVLKWRSRVRPKTLELKVVLLMNKGTSACKTGVKGKEKNIGTETGVAEENKAVGVASGVADETGSIGAETGVADQSKTSELSGVKGLTKNRRPRELGEERKNRKSCVNFMKICRPWLTKMLTTLCLQNQWLRLIGQLVI